LISDIEADLTVVGVKVVFQRWLFELRLLAGVPRRNRTYSWKSLRLMSCLKMPHAAAAVRAVAALRFTSPLRNFAQVPRSWSDAASAGDGFQKAPAPR